MESLLEEEAEEDAILAIMEEALPVPSRTHPQPQKQPRPVYTQQLTHLSSTFRFNRFPGQLQCYGKAPADILEAKAEINRTDSYAS